MSNWLQQAEQWMAQARASDSLIAELNRRNQVHKENEMPKTKVEAPELKASNSRDAMLQMMGVPIHTSHRIGFIVKHVVEEGQARFQIEDRSGLVTTVLLSPDPSEDVEILWMEVESALKRMIREMML